MPPVFRLRHRPVPPYSIGHRNDQRRAKHHGKHPGWQSEKNARDIHQRSAGEIDQGIHRLDQDVVRFPRSLPAHAEETKAAPPPASSLGVCNCTRREGGDINRDAVERRSRSISQRDCPNRSRGPYPPRGVGFRTISSRRNQPRREQAESPRVPRAKRTTMSSPSVPSASIPSGLISHQVIPSPHAEYAMPIANRVPDNCSVSGDLSEGRRSFSRALARGLLERWLHFAPV